jgi:4-carboxymuconolactone decarboxylase
MTETEGGNSTPGQRLAGDFMPKMASLIDDLVFGDIWERPGLTPRDRSLITVAGLIAAGGSTPELTGHMRRAMRNGLTTDELKEVILHLAFYAGWPKALAALAVARSVMGEAGGSV